MQPVPHETSPKVVKIACKTELNLALKDLHPIQGSLKELSKERYEMLKESMLSLGFSAPFFVWKNENKWNILDGTQRYLTLNAMQLSNYKLPDLFPSVEIFANSQEEAAQKLLSYISQFGEVTHDGLYEFIEQFNIPVEDIESKYALPNFDPPKFKAEFYEQDQSTNSNPNSQKKCPECGHEL